MKLMLVLLLLAAPLSCSGAGSSFPADCSQVQPKKNAKFYTVFPLRPRVPVQVDCDTETDGGRWTVIQRRMDGSVNFYRGWDQYVVGFGEPTGEHWLGLEFIHQLTSKGKHELLVEMEDFEGNKASARYSSFSVGAECDGYKLSVSGFINGGAGDSLTYSNNMKFTTFDKDQDVWPDNCAKKFLGGFWYQKCHQANPNGLYRFGADKTLFAIGVEWFTWKGYDYSLKSISLKIRPVE